MTYKDLPFLDNIALPRVEYGKAQALRQPLAHAINAARSQSDAKMEDVLTLLHAALKHITGAQPEVIDAIEDSITSDSDLLDSLLGTSEDGSDAS